MKKLTLLFAVLLSLVGVTKAWAQESLTIYNDADYSSDYVPFDGYDADATQQDQMIFPSSVLSGLVGTNIKSMTFYYKKNETSGTNVGNWIVSLGNTSATTLSALDNSTSLTQVYSGAITPNTTDKTITVTFDEDYYYDGGNLLVEFNHPVASGYKKFTFWCAYITPAPAYSKGATRTYLPKTTFTYEVASNSGPALAVKDGNTKLTSPYAYSFGLATAGTTKTFTLSNPGSEAATVSVAHTGDFGVELSANSIPAGESVNLTVTMPDATASDVITISSTDEGIDDFVINVSGTVRDPQKFTFDFSDAENSWPGEWAVANWTIADGIATAGTTEATAISQQIKVASGGENIFFNHKTTVYGGASYAYIKVYHSTSNSANAVWTQIGDAIAASYNEWGTSSVTIPETAKFIKIVAYRCSIDDFYGLEADDAAFASLGFSASDYNFSLIGEETTTEAYTITNDGTADLTGLSVTSSNPAFSISVADNATSIAAGGSVTFTVTMNTSYKGVQNGAITVAADGFTGENAITFNVSGCVLPENVSIVDFNDNALPAGWSKAGNTSFTDGAAYFYYSTNTLTSPKVSFAAGDFLVVKAKMASSYGYVTVKGSEDGVSFTQIKKLDSSVLNQTDYTICVVSDIPTTVKYIQLDGYYCYVDEIAGLTYAPVLSVIQGEAAVTTPANYDFGESGEEKTVTYSFANTGAGTISITGVEATGGYTTNWTESVAAPFDLVITQPYNPEDAGEKSGTVTVTTTEGEFVINLSGTTLAADAPKLAIYVGEELQEAGAIMDFGIITEATTKEFIIKNDGTGTLNITSIELPEGFSIDIAAPTEQAPLALTAGQSQTVKLTLAADAKAMRNDKVVIWPAGGMADFTLGTSATVLPGAEVVDFNNNALPNGWTNASWTFANGAATGKSKTAYLTTSKLKMTENDFIIVKAMAADAYSGNTLTILGSTDNGTTFSETLETIEFPSNSNTVYTNYVISNIPSTVTKIRFVGYYAVIDEIAGLTYDDNDPRMGVYTDAECTVATTASVSNDFGFVTEAQTATYYIKNDGTGTMTLALGDEPAGFTQSLDKTSVAAGEKATLTITMPVANKGYHAGNVVVTATDLGTFTASLTGVMVDENKLNLDFATANIPTTWTANSWEKNAGGYYRAGYSSTTMETSQLTAEAGEEIVIVAKNEYTGSYTFGVNYKKVDAEEWSTLIAAANLGTSWTTLHATIPEAGDYLLQFTGSYAQIKHIYGLTEPNEPVMVVYDGEAAAAATYSFGSVANDADAVKTFTVKNEGKAVLAGLTATLSGEQADNYTVAITGLTDGGVAAGETATVTVTQLKDNLGSHAATLTLSSTSEGIADFVIALSGTTRDASKLFVDFADGIPANWTAASWSAISGYAQTSYSGTCTLQTPALTVAAGEELSFDISKQYNSNSAQLAVRYTTDGGVTWTTQDLSSNLPYGSFTTKTLSLGNETEVTAVVQFVGTYYARLDNFYGGTVTAAPMISVTESGTAITNGAEKDFGTVSQTMGDQTATYVITNTGNADMVSTVTTTSAVSAVLSTTEAEGVTINGNQVTLAAGKTATITVTLPFTTPYGNQKGMMTITTDGWVGDLTQSYTASLIDPTALYVDFSDNSKPAGWYNAGWTFTSGYAQVSYTSYEMITEQFEADATKTTLSFEAKSTTSYSTPELTVYTSTDRKNWSEGKSFELTTNFQTFYLDALAPGQYYVKFVGKYAAVDNLAGLKTIDAPAHDLYVTSATLPTQTIVPGTSYTASVKVASLRAAETVAAELYFGDTKVAELTEQEIALNATGNFELTGNVPTDEDTYDVYIKVYNGDVAVETEKVSVEVAHTRTLAVQSFTTEDTELAANGDNEITVNFSATVKNTGTVALTAEQVSLTLMQGETEVVTATATDALDIDGETTVTLTKTISAGEGGTQTFAVRENLGNTVFATTRDIAVTASAPKFELAVKDGAAVANGDAVNFGLVKAATTKTYTITNSGTAALELISIVASEGFEATAVTDANKTIAAEGTLDIDVTLKEEQGKKTGTLVFTYKVDESANGTFTLNLSGRSVAADTWTVDFENGAIPVDWDNSNGWSVYNTDGNNVIRLSGWDAKSIMTPRLAATAGEELTFDVLALGNGISYAYSTDKKNWSEETTISVTGEQTFTAPEAGNYYLRFTGRNAYLDNFVGFQLNPLDHDTEITASSVPATAKQYNTYTATVTLKESAGKAEELTAQLFVGGEAKVAQTETITANGTTVITLTWEPQTVIEEAVKAFIKVTGTGIELATEEVDFTVAEVYTLDENATTATLETASDETVLLKRTFAEGWNTVCLPFDIDDIEAFFGADAKAYQMTGHKDGVLNFSRVTELSASYPYVVYVPAAITEPKLISDVTITSTNTTAFYNNFTSYGADRSVLYFRGTYAAVAAGEWTKADDGDAIYGVTPDGYIRPAGANASIKGFRAYFDLGAAVAAGVKGISFDGEEILTSLRSIFSDAENGQQIYDLDGRRVNRAAQKGVYIVDGKKIMVK
ncbi:MAG: choice-of-anchor D domain-containing protein [Bacteroidaceae bacterium]|nr:choice-of-anchor D domain-containing protein [Bacteroidaceae bacterium]